MHLRDARSPGEPLASQYQQNLQNKFLTDFSSTFDTAHIQWFLN